MVRVLHWLNVCLLRSPLLIIRHFYSLDSHQMWLAYGLLPLRKSHLRRQLCCKWIAVFCFAEFLTITHQEIIFFHKYLYKASFNRHITCLVCMLDKLLFHFYNICKKCTCVKEICIDLFFLHAWLEYTVLKHLLVLSTKSCTFIAVWNFYNLC